ncbi:MAG: hypothetical protein IKO93_05745 [Lentisphaeria bacterium]|nr:hypothetical protein [Lentisphaeria bacterium]
MRQNISPAAETISSCGMTVPSSVTGVFSGTEMCRTRPITVTYAPPAFRASGTKYSMAASGRSFSRAARSARRRFNPSEADIEKKIRMAYARVQVFCLIPEHITAKRVHEA